MSIQSYVELCRSPLFNESQSLTSRITRLSAIPSKVLALLHNFAASVYYEKAFSGLTESIFERYRTEVDGLLAIRCGDALEKVPAIYNRLSEGDQETVSQALLTCRRIIDSFADAIYPPSDETIEIDGQSLKLGKKETKNRIKAYMKECVSSESRRQILNRRLGDLYERLSTSVHSDVTIQEAKSLFLQTYLLLGEILTLSEPPPPLIGSNSTVVPLPM